MKDNFYVSRLHCSVIVLATILFMVTAGLSALMESDVNLPIEVSAPNGKLTLYAAFEAKSENSVPLYLVNRTDQPVKFSCQDGDLHLMLEHALKDGTWERCQSYGGGSWCGNSYYDIELPPGQFLKITGYMPAKGVADRVRFNSYGSPKITSNEGQGFYLPRDVDNSRKDEWGRKVSATISNLLESRGAPVSPESQVVALRMLQIAGVNPYYQNVAGQLAEAWEQKTSPTVAEVSAAKAFREILAEPWPAKRSEPALLAYCIAALSNSGKADGFGRPENDPNTVWLVLADLAQSSAIDYPNLWRPLVELVLKNETSSNVFGLMTVVSQATLADGLLPDTFFEKHILSLDPFTAGVCANTLCRRGRWECVAELGWKLDPRAQLIVLSALSKKYGQDLDVSDNLRVPEAGSKEMKFWTYCVNTQPLEVMDLLSLQIRDGNSTTYADLLHDPLRDYLDAVAAKGGTAVKDFDMQTEGYKLLRLVQLFCGWHRKEDIPLFQKLLEFRGYQKSEVYTANGDHHFEYRFRIREVAKQALLMNGEILPGNLVIVKEIPL